MDEMEEKERENRQDRKRKSVKFDEKKIVRQW